MDTSTQSLLVFSLAACLAACDGDHKDRADAGTPALAEAGTPASDAATSDAEIDLRPLPSGPPVNVGAPNVPEFKPAFPEQTRAPAIKTQTAFDVVEIASGFNKPWAIAFLPDMRMLVTEKPTGRLYIVTPAGKKSAVSGLPEVDGRGQGGLLDVELGPDYADSGLIYWTYYEPRQGGNGLAVARGKLNDAATPSVSDVEVIFRMQPTLESTAHAGGRLVFAPDGKLFVTLGERSILEGRMQAQDLESHFGKIVRIAPDGGVPEDNPFVSMPGARPEIWSSGHRNVLAGALDRARPAVGGRDGPTRRRRAQPGRARQRLRLADHRLRRGVLRPSDPREHSGSRPRAAGVLLGPGDLAVRPYHLQRARCSPSGAATSSSAACPAPRWSVWCCATIAWSARSAC